MGAGLITAEIIVGGLGRHSYYLQPSQRRLFVAVGWSDWIQTFITLMFTKISICLFLLRIVDGRKVRMAMHTLIGCLVLFTTVFTCLFLGICRPLKAYWNTGVESVCLSDKVVENILIAQGGSKALWKSMLKGRELIRPGSSFDRHRSPLRGLSDLLLKWIARQAENQDRVVFPDGPGRNARFTPWA